MLVLVLMKMFSQQFHIPLLVHQEVVEIQLFSRVFMNTCMYVGCFMFRQLYHDFRLGLGLATSYLLLLQEVILK